MEAGEQSFQDGTSADFQILLRLGCWHSRILDPQFALNSVVPFNMTALIPEALALQGSIFPALTWDVIFSSPCNTI